MFSRELIRLLSRLAVRMLLGRRRLPSRGSVAQLAADVRLGFRMLVFLALTVVAFGLAAAAVTLLIFGPLWLGITLSVVTLCAVALAALDVAAMRRKLRDRALRRSRPLS